MRRRTLVRADGRQQREHADRHQPVGRQIEQNRVGAGDFASVAHGQADEHVSRVRDARVCHQPIEIRLSQRHQVADKHCGHCKERE